MRKKSLITLGVLMNKKQKIENIMLYRYSLPKTNIDYINPADLKFINYTCNEYKKISIKNINIIYNFYYKKYGNFT